MSKNKEYSIADLELFVKSLDDYQAKQLCKYLSSYRRNRTYEFISKGPNDWKVNHIDISDIYVREVNHTVNSYLQKNDWSLKKIAEDANIHQLDEFKSQGHIDTKILSFISKRTGHGYMIVDGMHRIIRSACDGKKQFKLIYY
jgi:hypothetical protein